MSGAARSGVAAHAPHGGAPLTPHEGAPLPPHEGAPLPPHEGDAQTRADVPRVVLDTNLVLSLYAFADSRFKVIRQALRAGRIECFTRDDCLREFARVLQYPSLRIAPEKRASAFDEYRAEVTLAPAPEAAPRKLPRCKDRDDQKFLELARDCQAHYLATSDGALLGLAQRFKGPDDVRIMVPQKLIAALGLDDPRGRALPTSGSPD